MRYLGLLLVYFMDFSYLRLELSKAKKDLYIAPDDLSEAVSVYSCHFLDLLINMYIGYLKSREFVSSKYKVCNLKKCQWRNT